MIITGYNIGNLQEPTTGWQVRAYVSENFFDVNNVLNLTSARDSKGAYFFANFTTSAVPPITLPATTNSPDNPNAQYTILGIYDAKGKLKYSLLENFFLPDSLGSTTTVVNIEIANQSPFIYLFQRNRSYTDAMIDQKDAQTAIIAAAQAALLLAGTLSQTIPFTSIVPFSKLGTAMADKVVNADINFTVDATNVFPGATTVVKLTGDGTHNVTFTGFINISRGFNNGAGVDNYLFFYTIGGKYYVNIGGIQDVTAPTLVSATVEDAHKDRIILTYSENLNPGVTGAYTLSGGHTVTGASITGAVETLTVNPPFVSGESILISSSVSVQDQALPPNNAALLTNQTVTNNIVAPPMTFSNRKNINVSGNDLVATADSFASFAIADQFIPAGVGGTFLTLIDVDDLTISNPMGLAKEFKNDAYNLNLDYFGYVNASNGQYQTNLDSVFGAIAITGDKFGWNVSPSGVITPGYIRGGVWNSLTGTATYTGILYCGATIRYINGKLKYPQGNVAYQSVPILQSMTIQSGVPTVIELAYRTSESTSGSPVSAVLETGATGLPVAGEFQVLVNGSGRTVTGIAITGNLVKLTISAVSHGDTVTVKYVSGLSNPANRIRNSIGNRAAWILTEPVANNV